MPHGRHSSSENLESLTFSVDFCRNHCSSSESRNDEQRYSIDKELLVTKFRIRNEFDWEVRDRYLFWFAFYESPDLVDLKRINNPKIYDQQTLHCWRCVGSTHSIPLVGICITKNFVSFLTAYSDYSAPHGMESLPLLAQMATHVEEMHLQGMAHGNLAPPLREDGRLDVINFYPIPSGRYRAPENLLHNICSASADVFSFGMILYEVWTGLRPFHDRRSESCTILIHTQHTPEIPEGIPMILGTLLHDCWSYSPHSRVTAKEVRKTLQRILLYQSGIQAYERNDWTTCKTKFDAYRQALKDYESTSSKKSISKQDLHLLYMSEAERHIQEQSRNPSSGRSRSRSLSPSRLPLARLWKDWQATYETVVPDDFKYFR